MDPSRDGILCILRLFQLRTIFFTLLCGVALLPNVVERKKSLVSYKRFNPPTRFSLLHRFLFIDLHDSLAHIGWRLSSAYAMMIFYTLLVNPKRHKTLLTLLVRTPGRDTQQLNDRFVYISFLTLTVSLIHGLMNLFQQRRAVRFPAQSEPIPTRLQTRLTTRCLRLLQYLTFANIAYYFIYMMLRRPMVRLFLLRLFPLGSMLRPYLFSIMRKSAPTIGTFLTGFSISILVTLSIEVNDCLFDVYMTQTTQVSHYSSTPNATLVDGLRSPTEFFQTFAFQELATIACLSPERRRSIYRDVKTTPPTYAQIHQELQKKIDACTQALLPKTVVETPNEPITIPPPASLTSTKSGSPTRRAVAKTATIAQGSGLVSVPVAKKSYLLSLVESIFSPSTAPPEPHASISAQVPAVFRPAIEKVEKQMNDLASSTSGEVVKTVRSLETQVKGYVPRRYLTRLHDWLFEESLSNKIRNEIASSSIVELACLAQARLGEHSIGEDDYGTVQGSVPEALQGMLALQDGLTDYMEKLISSIPEGSPKRQEIDMNAGQILLAVRDALGIMLGAFGPFLGGLKLPSSVAQRFRSMGNWGPRRKR
ncbi:hypothetical protein BT69DRAFT_1337719 [Atractiella rhizophila]|nr:hypothetical protein BT69DRAFT_1337719 [Atractiella rhizophila]